MTALRTRRPGLPRGPPPQRAGEPVRGLVFGRLDIDHPPEPDTDGGPEREIRYIGRLGVRDDDYEPLVIDWRAPAASPFYRATPVEPMGVLRRRVLRCKGSDVVGIEDDLMVAEAPADLVVVGDGASWPRSPAAAVPRCATSSRRSSATRTRRSGPAPVASPRSPAGRQRQDRRRPASGRLPALQRPAPLRVRRHPRRRTLGRVHLVHRTRSAVPRRGNGDPLARRRRRRRQHRAPGYPGGRDQGRPADPPGAVARRPRRRTRWSRRVPRVRRRPGRAAQPADPRPGAVARPAPAPAEPRARHRGPAARRRRVPPERAHRARGVRGPVRGPPRGRDVPRGVVAALDPREVLLWLADEERLTRYAKGILDADETAVLLSAMRSPSTPGRGRWRTSPSSTTSPRASGRSRTSLARSAASTRSRS